MKFVRKIVRKVVTKVVRKGVRKGAIVAGLIVLSSFALTASAAGEFRIAGGRAAGMSGNSVALADLWSAVNNPAGTAFNKGIACGAFFENRFLLRELSGKTLVISAGFKPGVFSLSLSHFGSTVYNELKTGLGFARKFGKSFSAGVQLDYYRFGVSGDYGSVNLFNCEAGIFFFPLRQMAVGFHCINPVPVKIAVGSSETLPSLFRLGISYWFNADIVLSAEIDKGPESKARGSLAAECRFAGKVFARAGVSTGPFGLSMGAGIVLSRWCIDLATEYNQSLGFSPAISLQYQLKK